LNDINKIDGLYRIRFMTSHPKDLSDKLIEAVATLEKVCEHMHLPLQSGSDRILQEMNRRYTAAGYLRIVEKIKKAMPDASLTTDIMVAFPGETEEDFRATMQLVEQVGFDFLFAFKYSPRPGTAVAKLPDDVPQQVKEERLAALLDIAYGISAKKNATITGRTVEILVEEKRGDLFVGRTRTNTRVFFSAPSDCTGMLVPVTITGSKVNSLAGRLVSK